jgi:FKBP12-rapamycin complex-associated protein
MASSVITQLFEETVKGLHKSASVENVHGSLMAIGELLSHSGEFMLARYKEVVEKVLRFRDHRDKVVRNCVMANIPRLAHFAPQVSFSRVGLRGLRRQCGRRGVGAV